MSRVLQLRPVQVFEVPMAEGTVVLRPEQVIIRFPNNKTIDIGALCYLEREPAGRYRRSLQGRLVVLDSKSGMRVQQVRRLLAAISADLSDNGYRVETVRDRYSRFIAFMLWADTSGWQDVLDSEVAARSTIRAYCLHVRDSVARNELSNNSGARQLFCVIAALENLLELADLGRGLNVLRVNDRSKQSTSPPDYSDQARVLSLCTAIFNGLSELVLTKASYPFSLGMPDYLGMPHNRLWIFPTVSWFMPLSMMKDRAKLTHTAWAYNYSEGRLSTLEELQDIAGYANDSNRFRRAILKSCQKQIDEANSNAKHSQRRQAASQALNMFLILFLAQTGMNWAQVISLPWGDNFEVKTNHQAFRTIKWRAGGRTVAFEIPVEFMPNFRRYLAVRQYLLDGATCGYLFFRLGTKCKAPPLPISGPKLKSAYITLRRIDPGLPEVLSRQWRAAKSDWLVRNVDPATTALVLQNTEKTVLTSYAEGSETAQLEEMSNFLTQVSRTVLEQGMVVSGGVQRAIGVCSAFGNPLPTETKIAIRPDCKGPEGCLFCDHFKVHADEVDTRKLLSCRHCMRATLPMMGSEERVKKFVQPIFDRIEELVAEIRKRSSAMVERVAREVDEEGELDPYWARKLEMLMELGVIG